MVGLLAPGELDPDPINNPELTDDERADLAAMSREARIALSAAIGAAIRAQIAELIERGRDAAAGRSDPAMQDQYAVVITGPDQGAVIDREQGGAVIFGPFDAGIALDFCRERNGGGRCRIAEGCGACRGRGYHRDPDGDPPEPCSCRFEGPDGAARLADWTALHEDMLRLAARYGQPQSPRR